MATALASSLKFYYDVFNAQKCTAAGAANNTKPKLFVDGKADWGIEVLTMVSGTAAQVDLSTCSTFSAYVSRSFNQSDVLITIGNASITSTSKATGILSVNINSDVAIMKNWMGTDTSLDAYFELHGLDGSGNKLVSIQFPITVQNTVHFTT